MGDGGGDHEAGDDGGEDGEEEAVDRDLWVDPGEVGGLEDEEVEEDEGGGAEHGDAGKVSASEGLDVGLGEYDVEGIAEGRAEDEEDSGANIGTLSEGFFLTVENPETEVAEDERG